MAYNLKSEEEVKLFTENLGIEYRFGCYSEKNPESCHLLGDYFEAIKKDFPKAAKLYKDNCDERNYGKSCYKYGNYNLLGKGNVSPPGNYKDAYQYFYKGCNSGDRDACLNFGLLTVSPPTPEISMDVNKGVDALKTSCSKNNPNACYYLSGLFIGGVLKPEIANKIHAKPALANDPANYLLSQNMAEAFQYTQMACKFGHMYACANLSQMYERGEGVAQNKELAKVFKKKTLEMEEAYKKKQPSLDFQQGVGV